MSRVTLLTNISRALSCQHTDTGRRTASINSVNTSAPILIASICKAAKCFPHVRELQHLVLLRSLQQGPEILVCQAFRDPHAFDFRWDSICLAQAARLLVLCMLNISSQVLTLQHTCKMSQLHVTMAPPVSCTDQHLLERQSNAHLMTAHAPLPLQTMQQAGTC